MKHTAVILIIAIMLSLCACTTTEITGVPQNSGDATTRIPTSGTGGGNGTPTTAAKPTVGGPVERQVHVVLNFYAEEGAVIYKQDYDSYGYPETCYFHKKCEKCGYVSNNNGSCRGNISTSYHCTKCGNNQRVSIEADSDWVTVYE